MRSNQQKNPYFKNAAPLVCSVFILNLVFAAVAYAAAAVEWLPTTGVPVAGVVGDLSSAPVEGQTRIISDGSGNYITIWLDSDNNDIYAQKFDSTGAGLWTPASGVNLGGSGCMNKLEAITDDNGGAIVVWKDYCGDNQIFAMGIDGTDGSLAAGWTADGTQLIQADIFADLYDVVPDGSGGGIYLYQPFHFGTILPLRAQRFNSTGVNQWNAGGVNEDNGTQLTTQSPHLSRTGTHLIKTSDGVIASFNATWSATGKVTAQKVNMSGVRQWAAAGVQIANNTTVSNLLTHDGNNGAFITFVTNDGGGNFRNRVSHIDSSGALISGCVSGGNALSGGNPNLDQATAQVFDIAQNGSNQAFIGLKTITNNMRLALIASNCSETFSVSPVHSPLNDIREIGVTSDNNGGAYVLWEDIYSSKRQRILAQRVSSTGTSTFGNGSTTDLILTDRLGYNTYLLPAGQSEADYLANPWGVSPIVDSNGFVAVWNNYNNEATRRYGDNYIQRVTDTTPATVGDETEPWHPQGLPIGQMGMNVPVEQILRDSVRTSDGGYVAVWQDYADRYPGLYAVKFSANGVLIYSTLVSSSPISAEGYYAALTADNDDNVMVLYTSDDGMFAQKLDADGVPLWSANGGEEIESSNNATSPRILYDGTDGVYISWKIEDSETDNYSIQRLNADDGSFDTGFNGGEPISFPPECASCHLHQQRLILTASGGVILTYKDFDNTNYSINAVRYEADGDEFPGWGLNQHAAIITSDVELKYSAISDNNAGFILAYAIDNGSGETDIEAQRINGLTGNSVYTRTIANATDDQNNPEIVSDNNGAPSGAIIAWDDHRQSPDIDVYAQRINGAGVIQWAVNGIPISDITDGLNQIMNTVEPTAILYSFMVSNGYRGAVIEYQSETSNPAVTDIYGQYINGSGTKLWTSTSNGQLIETMGTSETAAMDIPLTLNSDNLGGGFFTWQRSGADGTFDIFTQHISNSVPPACVEEIGSTFCGMQEISSSTLTFVATPESFSFGEITSGSTQDIFNNNNTSNPPTDISPGADLLQVFDDRESGGFIVDIDTTGTFTDGVHSIPLSNLYVVTSLDETDPNNGDPGSGEEAGVTYDASIPTGVRNVVAPVYVDMDSANLASRTTYTNLAPDSQFGGSPMVLMNGTLPAAEGRSGNMSQFTNFHLQIPATQEPGHYDITLTYTLSDSTT